MSAASVDSSNCPECWEYNSEEVPLEQDAYGEMFCPGCRESDEVLQEQESNYNRDVIWPAVQRYR